MKAASAESTISKDGVVALRGLEERIEISFQFAIALPKHLGALNWRLASKFMQRQQHLHAERPPGPIRDRARRLLAVLRSHSVIWLSTWPATHPQGILIQEGLSRPDLV